MLLDIMCKSSYTYTYLPWFRTKKLRLVQVNHRHIFKLLKKYIKKSCTDLLHVRNTITGELFIFCSSCKLITMNVMHPPHLPFKYCSVWKISNAYIIYNFLPIVQVSGYLWPRKIVISLRFQTKTITKPNLESLHVSIL